MLSHKTYLTTRITIFVCHPLRGPEWAHCPGCPTHRAAPGERPTIWLALPGSYFPMRRAVCYLADLGRAAQLKIGPGSGQESQANVIIRSGHRVTPSPQARISSCVQSSKDAIYGPNQNNKDTDKILIKSEQVRNKASNWQIVAHL